MSEARRGPVLVVDDDADVRFGLVEILADEGFEVASAVHGAEALELLRAGLQPALILLDLRMPVMDGEAFCERWREDEALARLPVVIISADANAVERARRCGATGILEKPVDLDVLLNTIEKYARRT